MKPETRFAAKVIVDAATGCWLWAGSIQRSNGYGRFGMRLGGKMVVIYAHRASWLLHVGEIPSGQFVCHRCDTNWPAGATGYRRCVNPDHLFLSDAAGNAADARAKKRTATGDRNGTKTRPDRAARGSRCGTAKLSEASVLEMRRLRAQGVLIRMIARAFGVGPKTAGKAISGKTWGHVS